MESKEIEITVFDNWLKITSTFYAEQISVNTYRMLENDISNPRLTYGTEFETKQNLENKLEIVRITKHSSFITRRFLLSKESKTIDLKQIGDEIIKNEGYWQTDFGGIVTVNLPKNSKLSIDEIFKTLNFFPTEIKNEKKQKKQVESNRIEEYPSRIKNSISTFFLLTLFYVPVIFLILHWTIGFKLGEISLLGWTLFILPYTCICWTYLGLTNNNIIITEKEIKIVNTISFFKKETILEIEKIKSITFKHEWTEIFETNNRLKKISWLDFIAMSVFPYDYKWIRIIADKTYKVYCFGLEMDYYDNESPHFEELFYSIANKKIEVRWTNSVSNYYVGMNQYAENKKAETS